MNERIKEFAEAAGLSLSQKDYSYYWVESKEDIEKFAELIVRECVEVVGDCSDQFATRSQITEEIKEHFGVEE